MTTFIDDLTTATITLVLGIAAITISTLPTIGSLLTAIKESKSDNSYSLTEAVLKVLFWQTLFSVIFIFVLDLVSFVDKSGKFDLIVMLADFWNGSASSDLEYVKTTWDLIELIRDSFIYIMIIIYLIFLFIGGVISFSQAKQSADRQNSTDATALVMATIYGVFITEIIFIVITVVMSASLGNPNGSIIELIWAWFANVLKFNSF
jgi:hypothetical protein